MPPGLYLPLLGYLYTYARQGPNPAEVKKMPVAEQIPVGEEVLEEGLEDIASLDVLEGMAAPEVLRDIAVTPVRTQTGSSSTALPTAARGVSVLLALWLGGVALLGLCILLLYQLIWVLLGTL